MSFIFLCALRHEYFWRAQARDFVEWPPVWVFWPLVRSRVRNTHEVLVCPSQSWPGGLARAASLTWCLHAFSAVKLLLSLQWVNLLGDYLRSRKYPIASTLLLRSWAFSDDSCPGQSLLWWLTIAVFLIPSFFLRLFSWLPKVRKDFPFVRIYVFICSL